MCATSPLLNLSPHHGSQLARGSTLGRLGRIDFAGFAKFNWVSLSGWVVRVCFLFWLFWLIDGVTVAQAGSDDDRLQQALSHVHKGELAGAVEVIGPLNTPATITPTFGRLSYLKATLAQRLQDETTARQAYTLVWLTYPPLADYAAWELAQDAAKHDNLQTLEGIVNALTIQYPSSRHAPNSYLLLAQTQRRLGHLNSAHTTAERLLHFYPSHRTVPQALFLKAQLAEDATDLTTAASLYRDMGASYPHHALAAIALSRSHELYRQLPASQRPQPNPQHELDSLEGLIQARHWPEIERRLNTLTRAPSTTISASRLLLLKAIVAQKQRRWREATTLLKRLLLRHPNSPERGETHYRLARVYRRQGKLTAAERQYRQTMTQPHDAVWAPKAQLKLARELERRDEFAAASQLYQQFASTFPNHGDAPFSLWQAGWLQYRLGNYPLAVSIWRQVTQQFPDTVWHPQALYWLGRVAQLHQDLTTAKGLFQRVLDEYPFHYYSLRAREQLQQLAVPIRPKTLPEVAPLPWDTRPPVTLHSPQTAAVATPQQHHLTRVHEFQHLQMHRNARDEISALAELLPQGPATDFFIATLLSNTQQHLAVFRRLNRVVRSLTPAQVRSLPREFWTLLYPKTFWGEVTAHARQYGLSPYFILSLIRQESAFNPRALSSANARGLMQLIPSTARLVARQTRLRPFNLQMLFDPNANIQLGTHYFASQLQRFGHNPVFALAAYNAGPNRMKKWRTRWPNLPPDEFVEHIPFNETRLYVKLILRNLLIYETLYNPMSDA